MFIQVLNRFNQTGFGAPYQQQAWSLDNVYSAAEFKHSSSSFYFCIFAYSEWLSGSQFLSSSYLTRRNVLVRRQIAAGRSTFPEWRPRLIHQKLLQRHLEGHHDLGKRQIYFIFLNEANATNYWASMCSRQ